MSISPQRILNRQSIQPQISNEFETQQKMNINKILELIAKYLPNCPNCLIKQKTHYCIQIQCPNKSLLCIECDVKSIHGKHFLHDFSYVAPLFMQRVWDNIQKLRIFLNGFLNSVNQQLKLTQQFLTKLDGLANTVNNQLQQLDRQQQKGKSKWFKSKVNQINEHFKQSSKDKITNINFQQVFNNVKFISEQQCAQMQQKIKQQLIDQISKLNRLDDSQSILNQALKVNEKPLSSTLLHENQLQLNESFISSKKKIQISEIDDFFRDYNELLTQRMQYHRIQLKIQAQFLKKSKFYQALIYHFRDCQKLTIDNANISNLKTPLGFRRLKQLQFNCNVETDMYVHNRIDDGNRCRTLQSFIIRKFRQEDIKVLKLATFNCINLKHLHIQFFNKTDLFNNQQLIQYIKSQSHKDLISFELKLRTQNDVKRLYGYLAKFYRQQNISEKQQNLNHAILDLLRKNPNLTKVNISGVNGLDANQILRILADMKYLMQYKITYQNMDLMIDLDDSLNRELYLKTEMRRRILSSLTKMSKQKLYSQNILHTIAEQFLI